MKKIIALFGILLFYGCEGKLPLNNYIGYDNYELLNQESSVVVFPQDYEGKILLIGFIFTNCPDICPMTTHNLHLVQQELKKENINNVQIAALTFDPERDTPGILKEYARIRKYDLSNWDFLTGNRKDIDTLKYLFSIVAISGDTTYTQSGDPIYFYTHRQNNTD
ncbi:MAG: SCO family protein [Bacteroidetes bacterium]|nr:SCO family protein [Bacteroidota bacterium]